MSKNATPRGAGEGKADGKTEQTTAARTAPDWELIERLYRAGQLSLRQIGKQGGCDHALIMRRAKKLGWVRNLSEKVRQGVTTALVTTVVTTREGGTEKEIVDTAVANTIALVREHITQLRKGSVLARMLFEQLEEAAVNRPEIELAIQEETSEADNPSASKGAQQAAWARRGQMLRAVSLPAHAAVLKDLAIVLKVIIPMERQAFNVDGAEPERPDEGIPAGMMDLDAFGRKIDAHIASRRAAVA